MRVCVTGGCGFVGRRFVKRFLETDCKVTVVDDYSTGLQSSCWTGPVQLTAEEFHRVRWRAMDCREFFRTHVASTYDLVVHCAAVVGGRKKIEGDPIAVATDLSVDSEFFQWCVRRDKPKKVIYFSSSAVYPIELQQERMHCGLVERFVDFDALRIGMPDQTYGWAKLTGEMLAQHAVKTYGLDVVIYRPFSGYGEDQDLGYPFPALLQRVGRGDDPVEVWGRGDQRRDFIHIDDVVDCVLRTYDALAPGAAMNIGSGEGLSFLELINKMAVVVGRETPPAVCACRDMPVGVFSRVADTALMRQYYKPRISLEEGIRRCYEHMKAHGLLDKQPILV